MLLRHLFGGHASSLRFRFEVCGLLQPETEDLHAKRPRAKPFARVGDLESTRLMDRWRHCALECKWWKAHFCNEATWVRDTWWYLEFRKKFRVPPCVFRELKAESNTKCFADSVTGRAARRGGPPRIPLDLKMAACLRVLATGCTFDVFEEPAGMDKETLRRFFHAWMEHLATNVAPRYIKPPQGAELDACMDVYSKLGFPGACMSVDATHCPWDRVPAAQHANHKGKEGFPTLVWNCHVTHDRQFRHVELAQAGARNDKTLAQYDSVMQSIKDGTLYADKAFSLYAEDGTVTQVQGLYLICDGGYHMWRCLQFPLKHASTLWERRWSKRMESVRKDVETAFGILKQRFRILKVPFLFKDAQSIHNVFVVCCMLHNRLLKFDGLHNLGRSERDWIKASLTTDDERVDAQHAAWMQGMQRSAADPEVERHLAHFQLRDQLIAHYKYVWEHKMVLWRVTAQQRKARLHAAAADAVAADHDDVELEDDDEDVDSYEDDDDESNASNDDCL